VDVLELTAGREGRSNTSEGYREKQDEGEKWKRRRRGKG